MKNNNNFSPTSISNSILDFNNNTNSFISNADDKNKNDPLANFVSKYEDNIGSKLNNKSKPYKGGNDKQNNDDNNIAIDNTNEYEKLNKLTKNENKNKGLNLSSLSLPKENIPNMQKKENNTGKTFEKVKNMRINSSVDEQIVKNTFNNYYAIHKFKETPEYKKYEEEYEYYSSKIKAGIMLSIVYTLFMSFDYFDKNDNHYENLDALIKDKKTTMKSKYTSSHRRNILVVFLLGSYLSWNFYKQYKVEAKFKKEIYSEYFGDHKMNMSDIKLV